MNAPMNLRGSQFRIEEGKQAVRRIVLDTETTGLEPADGHRVIEIGAVEIVDRRRNGQHFHSYLNPQRDIEDGALEVHGITREFLLDKPVFADVAVDFLKFIRGAELIIHNAPFDLGFLDMELSLLQDCPGCIRDFCSIVDTLELARELHPGQRNNLDALCKRYEIDNTSRVLHGALRDAEILADVYLAMTGGQTDLGLSFQPTGTLRAWLRYKSNPAVAFGWSRKRSRFEGWWPVTGHWKACLSLHRLAISRGCSWVSIHRSV
jgi:DNA polymerase-3 subunit epsilon